MLGTTNRGKIGELIALLDARWPQGGSAAWQIEAIAPGELPAVEETGATVAENAAIKASAYARACGEWTLADDTALMVDALGGAPGIHTARYAGPNASPAENRRRLLAELADVAARPTRCPLHVSPGAGRSGGHDPAQRAEGCCHGRICTAPAGDEGFGYDPLFEIIEFRRTFAELSLATRSVLSHRARATEKIISQIARLLALDPSCGRKDRRHPLSTSPSFSLIAKTFFGLEGVLAQELKGLGALDLSTGRRMVSFTADQALLYRANLWCRTAVRILKPIAQFTVDAQAADPYRSLYAEIQEIDWEAYLRPTGTLAIDPVVNGQVADQFALFGSGGQRCDCRLVSRPVWRAAERRSGAARLAHQSARVGRSGDRLPRRLRAIAPQTGLSAANGRSAAQRSAGRGHFAADRLGRQPRRWSIFCAAREPCRSKRP